MPTKPSNRPRCSRENEEDGERSDEADGMKPEVASLAVRVQLLGEPHGGYADVSSVPIPKFVALYGATFRTSESKGH